MVRILVSRLAMGRVRATVRVINLVVMVRNLVVATAVAGMRNLAVDPVRSGGSQGLASCIFVGVLVLDRVRAQRLVPRAVVAAAAQQLERLARARVMLALRRVRLVVTPVVGVRRLRLVRVPLDLQHLDLIRSQILPVVAARCSLPDPKVAETLLVAAVADLP